MRIRNLFVGGLVAVSLTAGAVGISMAPVAAVVPDAKAGNITAIPNPPRLVPSPGDTLQANTLKHVKVAGETFGGVTIPDNATAVSINVSNNQSPAAGQIRVSAKGTPRSGSATISWVKGEANTASVFVAIGEDKSITFDSTITTRYLVSFTAFVTPEVAPAAPVIKSIAKKGFTPIKVGGPFRARNTDMGEVTLEPGTYDARVLAQFQGLNQTTDPTKAGYNTVPADVKLTGTVVISLGDEVLADFSNNISVGGLAIQDSASETLTVETAGGPNTIFTITEATDVHVRVFAQASNSSEAGSDQLKVALDSAVFRKL